MLVQIRQKENQDLNNEHKVHFFIFESVPIK